MADEVTRTIVDGMGGTGTAFGAGVGGLLSTQFNQLAQAIAGLKPTTTA